MMSLSRVVLSKLAFNGSSCLWGAINIFPLDKILIAFFIFCVGIFGFYLRTRPFNARPFAVYSAQSTREVYALAVPQSVQLHRCLIADSVARLAQPANRVARPNG
jgi:hypothetical protein